MGIFQVKSKVSNKILLDTSQNLKGYINRTRFQLNAGSHPNVELQREWKEEGEDSFIIEILEILEYDKDESKTDYKEELEVMKYVWKEKLIILHNYGLIPFLSNNIIRIL